MTGETRRHGKEFNFFKNPSSMERSLTSSRTHGVGNQNYINFIPFLPTDVTINLEAPDSEVVESVGAVIVRVTLSAPFPENIDFVIRTIPGTANG